jgi:hypothetical protein
MVAGLEDWAELAMASVVASNTTAASTKKNVFIVPRV